MIKTIRASFLLRKTRRHIKAEFRNSEAESLVHRYKDARSIVKVAARIARQYQLSKIDGFVLLASCWFYDLGYVKDFKNPQLASAGESDKFYKDHKVHKDIMEQIRNTLLSVQSQRPGNDVQAIFCDAATHYVGLRKFDKISRLRRKQEENETGKAIPKAEWREKMIRFLSEHQFYTEYAKQRWSKRKRSNLKKLTWKESKENVVSVAAMNWQ